MKKERLFLVFLFLCYSMASFNCNQKGHGLVDITKRIKGRIDTNEAKSMRKHYKNEKEHFKIAYLDSNGNRNVDILEGFRLDTADINSMINYAPGKKASSIILYFGRHPNNIPIGSKNHPSYTIIAMPVDSNNKVIQAAYDKADPCPPYCPDN